MKAIISSNGHNEKPKYLGIDVIPCHFCKQQPLTYISPEGWSTGCLNFNDYNMRESGATEYCECELEAHGYPTVEESVEGWNNMVENHRLGEK